MGPWVPTYFFLQAIMDALIGQDPSSGTDMPLQGIYVGLTQVGSPNPNNNTTLAQITEATYDGYARQPVVWFPPYIDLLGPVGLTAANVQFRPTDSTVPNNIGGAFLATKVTGGALLAANVFQTPVMLASPSNAFTLAVVFQMSNANNYGKPLVYA